jgi:serine/threonine protein kinase
LSSRTFILGGFGQKFKPLESNDDSAEFRGLLERLTTTLDFIYRILEDCATIPIKTDKGSAIVVMDKTTYIQEAERQLSDCRFYEKLDSDPTLDFTQKIIRALEAMHARGHLDNKTMEYLTPEDPKLGRFYLLPKIHKENNPGRPIVSANGHPTEKISEFIDFHLRPFVENLPSHNIVFDI